MKMSLDVLSTFPEIDGIVDPELKRKVVRVWERFWEESAWERIEDMPTSLDIPAPHVPHNRAVVAIALAIADAFERFHDMPVDRDRLLAGGFLQDASKLVETMPAEDGIAQTDRGRLFPHAYLGAQVAMEEGVDDIICDIILNHTPQSAHFPKSVEGRILFFADQVDLLGVNAGKWKKVLMLGR